jgi:hypothetical protein
VRRHVSICTTEFLSTSTGRGTIVYDGTHNWPRIGPATYCTTTQEDELRREANPQLDWYLKASPQVAESVPGTLSSGDTGPGTTSGNVALLGASLGMLGFVVAAEESFRFTDKPSVQ